MNQLPIYTRQEIQRLYAACDDTRNGRYAYTLLAVLLNTGLSLDDVRGLRHGHLDFERRWLWASQGLRPPRFIPLNRRLEKVLTAWLALVQPARFLFGRQPDGQQQASHADLALRLQQVSMASGVDFSVQQAQATLAHQLLLLSDEGALFRSVVPPEDQGRMRLPLDHLPPFSAINRHADRPFASKGFIPLPSEFNQPPAEDSVIAYGRRLLERAGEQL